MFWGVVEMVSQYNASHVSMRPWVSIPSTHVKSRAWQCILGTSVLGRQMEGLSEACWLASFAELMSSSIRERPCLKTYSGDEKLRKTVDVDLSTSHAYSCTRMCRHTWNVHMHTPHIIQYILKSCDVLCIFMDLVISFLKIICLGFLIRI